MDTETEVEGLDKLLDITVNGVAVSRQALAEWMQSQGGVESPPTVAAAARTLVVQELLLQEARNRDIKVQDDAEGPQDKAMVRQLLEQSIQVEKPTEADCREFFSRNPDTLSRKELLEVSHILIGADTKVPNARQHARDKAVLIIELLREFPQRFGEIARENSDCQSREVGGNLGQIGRGQMVPEFDQQVFDLEQGLAPEPIDTRYGYHVVRLDRKILGPPVSFGYVRHMIEEYLTEKQHRIAVRQYIADLLSRADVQGIAIEELHQE